MCLGLQLMHSPYRLVAIFGQVEKLEVNLQIERVSQHSILVIEKGQHSIHRNARLLCFISLIRTEEAVDEWPHI